MAVTETLVIMEPYEEGVTVASARPVVGEDGDACQIELELLVYGKVKETYVSHKRDLY